LLSDYDAMEDLDLLAKELRRAITALAQAAEVDAKGSSKTSAPPRKRAKRVKAASAAAQD
jgi:hypothetical protein